MNNNQQEILFKAEGISKSFKKNTELCVLDDLNLSVQAGEIISVVGASGVGKTTLLNILGTLECPTSGHLFHRGEDVFNRNSRSLSAFRNKTIGFVFQFHHLLPEFTALENIMIPGLIAREEKSSLQEKAQELLNRIGLSARGSHQVGELSGGEQQRISLARALIMKPTLLLADEPTGNLDPKTGMKMFEMIAEITKASSLSTVMVTHNLELAKETDRCLTLMDGKLYS